MKNAHLIDQPNTGERLAAEEWEALLGRLRSNRPDAAHARLQRVRHAIASGEFQVDARNIAERLIRRLLAS